MRSQFQLSAFQRFSVSAFSLLPLAWLWFVLIDDLRIEWTVNPQYSYGWAVPFLCVVLLWKRIQKAETLKAGSGNAGAENKNQFQFSAFSFQLLFVLLAFLYAPTRLIEEANPGWRLVSWALALETVGLTLLLLRPWLSAFQRFSFSALIFPVCFFLVAVPWPTRIEMPLIQGLTRADTNVTTEFLGWLGVPALAHGNVIEVATGVVGIDEACSGIRSFQATLMISLFFGEFYRLNVLRRGLCVLAGFALSFLFNMARTTLLTWGAAKRGVAAIAAWHDPAGVTILVACFLSLWLVAVWLGGKRRNEITEKLKTETLTRLRPTSARQEAEKLETETLKVESGKRTSDLRPLTFVFRPLTIGLTAWIVLTELGVEAWYRSHEARVPVAAQWTVAWPTNDPGFEELPLSERTRQILRYDEGHSAAWEAGGLKWQAVFLRWKPGRTAIHLAQNHTPEICMTTTGYTLKSISSQEWFDVDGVRLPFLAYQVTDAPQAFFVFYCLWDDRASAQGFKTMSLTYGNRLAPVLAGLRNPGQRSLEIAVAGLENAEQARTALRAELEELIASKP
jgi:exosortase